MNKLERKVEARQSRNEAKFFAKTVYDRARCRCEICEFYCPFTGEIHHIVPVKDGGDGLPDNLIHLCPNCHRVVEKISFLLEKQPFYENPYLDDWLCDNYTEDRLGMIRSLVMQEDFREAAERE